jgi:hypothetical protein
MCLMNLFLHNIGELDGEPSVERSMPDHRAQAQGGLRAGQPALRQEEQHDHHQRRG